MQRHLTITIAVVINICGAFFFWLAINKTESTRNAANMNFEQSIDCEVYWMPNSGWGNAAGEETQLCMLGDGGYFPIYDKAMNDLIKKTEPFGDHHNNDGTLRIAAPIKIDQSKIDVNEILKKFCVD